MKQNIQISENLLSRADFAKGDGLLPAIVQHIDTGEVLMQAWMNKQALAKTLEIGQVTFFSRSRQQLWTKGETSGNLLKCLAISLDCDNDSLLVMAKPFGPTCHTGTNTCWHDDFAKPFLCQLDQIIYQRKQISALEPSNDCKSYTMSLFRSGSKRIAQKVGEEGVETALAGATGNKQELVDEAADLLFHLMVLLQDQDLCLESVQHRLYERHNNKLR